MNPKRTISKKIKALKDIAGVCVSGTVYELDEMMKMFPYIDYKNTVYFEDYFEHKFEVGDKVRYTGSIKNNIDKTKPHKVISYRHDVRLNREIVYYTISNGHTTYQVEEKFLEFTETRYIISFSGARDGIRQHPDVLELEFYAYEHRIKNSWKDMFTFPNKEIATEVAKLFSEYTPLELLSIVKNYKK